MHEHSVRQRAFSHSELPYDLEEDNGEDDEEEEEVVKGRGEEENRGERKGRRNSTQTKEFVLVSPSLFNEKNDIEKEAHISQQQEEEDDEEERGIEPHGTCGILTFNPYSNFVLLALTLCYGSSVYCRYLISVTSKEMQADQGWGNAQGTGIEYDLLFGPIFVGVGSVSVLVLAWLVEFGTRKWGIMICMLGWCTVTFVTSFTTVYWQLLLLRIAIAILTACTPLVLSMLVNYFPEDLRGTALSIYNFALYIGYSCALGVGAFFTTNYGWRKAFQFAAASGFPAVICLLFVREPSKEEISRYEKKWPQIIPYVNVAKKKQVKQFLVIMKNERLKKSYTSCCRDYKNVFLGKECVDVILSLGVISSRAQDAQSSRAEAVKWGNALFKRNYFRHVTGDYALIDGNFLYRFRPHCTEGGEEEEEGEGVEDSKKREGLRLDVFLNEEVINFLYNYEFSSDSASSSASAFPSSATTATFTTPTTTTTLSTSLLEQQHTDDSDNNHHGNNKRSAKKNRGSSSGSSSKINSMVSGKEIADVLCECVSVPSNLGTSLGEELMKLGYLESLSQPCFIASHTPFYSFVERKHVKSKRVEYEKQLKKTTKKPSFFTGLAYFAQDKISWGLFIAGGLRWGAGFIWAQYTDIYYATEYPLADRSNWLGWIPTAGGLLGVGAGGLIGDRAVVKHGIWARTAVISISCFCSIPFQLGALYCDVPLAFLMLLPMYMCSEMWIGLCLAAVLEVCPSDLRTIGISVYLFIINNIGGLLNVCVEPLGNVLSDNANLKLKYALSILFPGMFLTSGVLFMCVTVALRRRTAPAFAEEKQRLLRKLSSRTR